MKSMTESVCKTPKSRNFDVLYAFSVRRIYPNSWLSTKITKSDK
jgi:hypothetical protein